MKGKFNHAAVSGMRKLAGVHTVGDAMLYMFSTKWNKRHPAMLDLAATVLQFPSVPGCKPLKAQLSSVSGVQEKPHWQQAGR